jgi:hypothetical protein
MDQGKGARRVLAVRVSDEAYQLVADRARRADVDVSHMARRMLSYASANMPDGWVPPMRKVGK